MITLKSDKFPYSQLIVTPAKLVSLTNSLMAISLPYVFGGKIEPLSLQAEDLEANGIKGVDCSGFVRWCLYHATAGQEAVPDGSGNQHDWIKENGFKSSTVNDATRRDNVVRIAFLEPSGDEPGHVMLIVNGMTCESHGDKGPDHRVWGSEQFMQDCVVYVLCMPV